MYTWKFKQLFLKSDFKKHVTTHLPALFALALLSPPMDPVVSHECLLPAIQERHQRNMKGNEKVLAFYTMRKVRKKGNVFDQVSIVPSDL